ncbi:pyridoxal phosphate-dependent transferase [Xylariaceae sp. FL0016]|nr:pyridoxal phosphate-dependent transferase [Xylariaceae sp. FL0016]
MASIAETETRESLATARNEPVFDSAGVYSDRVSKWQPPAISSLLPIESLPGMVSLVVGKPNPDCFPFSGISISLKGTEEQIHLDPTDLHDAFQYALIPGGIKELRQWFETLQHKVHSPGSMVTWGCSIGSGSQDLLHKSFQVFTDPGDPVLIDTYERTRKRLVNPPLNLRRGTLGFLDADGHNLIEVMSDAEGLMPAELERILSTWPHEQRRPRVLLRLAKKYSFLIFEDDAYYFLDFADPCDKVRSYLSLEASVNGEIGRVLRFDSLSKIVSAGIRIGFLTAAPLILDKVNMITGHTNLQPASTSQVMTLALLRHWSHDGFLAHTRKTAAFYRQQRDILVAAAGKHLRGKATWEVPTAGMFLWIRLLLSEEAHGDSFDVLTSFAAKVGVIAVPGVAFMPSRSKSCHLRLSYSLVTEDMADEAYEFESQVN